MKGATGRETVIKEVAKEETAMKEAAKEETTMKEAAMKETAKGETTEQDGAIKEAAIKQAMEQVHIPEKMQEDIIAKLQGRMETGWFKTRKRKVEFAAAIAVTFVLAAGVASISVQAIAENAVRARMENLSREEVKEMENLLRKQRVLADTYSREFSENEEQRYRELWRAYEKGTFPQKEIPQANNLEEVEEGAFCYLWDTSEYCLPDRELTDEELLEMIDLSHKQNYALSQSQAVQEVRAEMEAEQKRLKEEVAAAGGITEAEALEIAENYLRSRLGDEAKEMTLERIMLMEQNLGASIIYYVVYKNKDWYENQDIPDYVFVDIDSGDGRILKAH